MVKPGPKTQLNKELFAKIKQCILGANTLRETARLCEIPESTFYTWHSDNYLNIKDKIEGWRRDSKLEKSDLNLEKILLLDPGNKDFTKAVLDASKFIKKTLDKKHYSERSEVTGADGKDLEMGVVILPAQDKDDE